MIILFKKLLKFGIASDVLGEVGVSTSSTFSNTPPGNTIPNFIPVIKSIVFEEVQQKITIVVQDNEGDQMLYDAQSADYATFKKLNNLCYRSRNYRV